MRAKEDLSESSKSSKSSDILESSYEVYKNSPKRRVSTFQRTYLENLKNKIEPSDFITKHKEIFKIKNLNSTIDPLDRTDFIVKTPKMCNSESELWSGKNSFNYKTIEPSPEREDLYLKRKEYIKFGNKRNSVISIKELEQESIYSEEEELCMYSEEDMIEYPIHFEHMGDSTIQPTETDLQNSKTDKSSEKADFSPKKSYQYNNSPKKAYEYNNFRYSEGANINYNYSNLIKGSPGKAYDIRVITRNTEEDLSNYSQNKTPRSKACKFCSPELTQTPHTTEPDT